MKLFNFVFFLGMIAKFLKLGTKIVYWRKSRGIFLHRFFIIIIIYFVASANQLVNPDSRCSSSPHCSWEVEKFLDVINPSPFTCVHINWLYYWSNVRFTCKLDNFAASLSACLSLCLFVCLFACLSVCDSIAFWVR